MEGAQLTLCLDLAYLETIRLDIKHPKLCPYPFKIYPAVQMPGVEENELHEGFVLVMRAKYQDPAGGQHSVASKDGSSFVKKIKPFKFRAWVEGPQEIRVACPLLSWSDRGNDDRVIRADYGDMQPIVMEALDAARNAYIKRQGIDNYETAEKIYILQLSETDYVRIKLDGSVLLCNKKAKKLQHLNEPGLLSAMALNVTTNISTLEDAEGGKLDEITVHEKTLTIWKTAQVPLVVWQVANVAQQARKLGDLGEDSDMDEDEDLIVKEMSKKTRGLKLGKF